MGRNVKRRLIQVWCVSCKKKVDIYLDTCELRIFKNKRRAVSSKCPSCNTNVFKILSKNDLQML